MVTTKGVRHISFSIVRAPVFSSYKLDVPLPVRYFCPGNPSFGAKILQGFIPFRGHHYSFNLGQWNNENLPVSVRSYFHGFTWIKHLRALGIDAALLRTRQLIDDWSIFATSDNSVAYSSEVIADRLFSWLAHYNYFAASADGAFRKALMAHMLSESRILSGQIHFLSRSLNGLKVIRGLMAVAVAFPEYWFLQERLEKYLPIILKQLIFSDGFHVDRNPSIHLQAVRCLQEIAIIAQQGGLKVARLLEHTLNSMVPVLQLLRHGDGGMALFNGGMEEDPLIIDQFVGASPKQGVNRVHCMSSGGFIRVHYDKSLLIVNSGCSTQITSSQCGGLFSFEFSSGKQRLIVNCGASDDLVWEDALRSTAAHSVLSLGRMTEEGFIPYDGREYPPKYLDIQQNSQKDEFTLLLRQDGLKHEFGVVLQRKFFLSSDGGMLQGEERIEKGRRDKYLTCVVRFHLHPSVQVYQRDDSQEVWLGYTNSTSGLQEKWCFTAKGGLVTIEESVYHGTFHVIKTTQIVIWVVPDDWLFAQLTNQQNSSENQEIKTTLSNISNPRLDDDTGTTISWALKRSDWTTLARQ